jgi:hypothetical protein
MSGLTGRFNLTRTWRGRLALVVEEEYPSLWGGEKRRWRRATLADLAEPEMRALVDLRFQRQFTGRPAKSVEPVAKQAELPNTVISPSATTQGHKREDLVRGPGGEAAA